MYYFALEAIVKTYRLISHTMRKQITGVTYWIYNAIVPYNMNTVMDKERIIMVTSFTIEKKKFDQQFEKLHIFENGKITLLLEWLAKIAKLD